MTRKVLLVDIGAGDLPATTAPLTIDATWMPKAYTPPPIGTPTGLTVVKIANGVRLIWTPTVGTETVIETAPDVAGAPGTWTLSFQSTIETYIVSTSTPRWVRLKAVKNGRSSAYTTAVLATPGTLDDVADGPIYSRPRTSVLQNGVVLGIAHGANKVPNPNFANAVGTTPGVWLTADGVLCDNWRAVLRGGSYFRVLHENGANALIRFREDCTLPANSGWLGAYIYSTRLDVEPSRKYRLVSTGSNSRNQTPPAAFLCIHRLAVDWLSATGAYITTVYHDYYTSWGDFVHDDIYLAPANAASAIVYCLAYANNNSAAPLSPAGWLWADMRFKTVSMVLVGDIDREIADGSLFSRVTNNNLVGNTIGLYLANSGHQVGGQENLLPITVASYSSRWDGLSITYSVPTTGTPATVTINASAATLRMGSAKNYNASSVQVTQARSTTQMWHLYYIDPTFAAGAKTLNATTDPNTLVNTTGIVWVGPVEITTPSVGTGATGSGFPGGGCVAATAYMADGRHARDWRVGDCSPCSSPAEGFTVAECVSIAAPVLRPCVRLTMTSGRTLTLSADTPIDCPDGLSVEASHMLGRPIRAWHGAADRRIEYVIDVALVGYKHVVPMSFGGRSFPAGDSPDVLFYTHNADKP